MPRAWQAARSPPWHLRRRAAVAAVYLCGGVWSLAYDFIAYAHSKQKFRSVDRMDLQYTFLMQKHWGTLRRGPIQWMYQAQVMRHLTLLPSIFQSHPLQAYLLRSCLKSYLPSILRLSLLRLTAKKDLSQRDLVDADISFLEVYQNRLLVFWNTVGRRCASSTTYLRAKW